MKNARLVLQVYDPARRGYRDVGCSIARIPVNVRERRRLWAMLTTVVDDRDWKDPKADALEIPHGPTDHRAP